jgi:putative phosphoesterase
VKIAVIADIHGHLAALEAVSADIDTWGADAVAVAGDIVNRGPRPRECLDLVLARAKQDEWCLIRGNHERYVMHAAHDPTHREGLEGDVRESVRWTLNRLGTTAELAGLPERARLTGPDGSWVRIIHATMRHDRDNLLLNTRDEELRKMIDPHAAVFCCGHTHRPLIRQIDQTLVVNVGSVGLPFDNDPRACYARLEWHPGGWHAELVRVTYDRERALRDMQNSGLIDACRATGQIILAELVDARPYMAKWVATYDAQVRAGQMTAEASVQRFLAEQRAG